MTIKQKAGDIEFTAYTDGYPIQIVARLHAGQIDSVDYRLSVNDLHDLRYCVDRVLAQLQERKP
ncbi:hypothetical protein CG471_16015 [Sphingobium sp. IP1]|uniref:hypothetical protein n=1 Tax=Sphingobium sp. IP1 TaxID=2021637 RepID=UPI000C07CFE1|nr:hypothetical protein [Sphingobium sp. IP1]PHP18772.1 hypothetical protein CG471_16015 [Sphingobium sp. IP1]